MHKESPIDEETFFWLAQTVDNFISIEGSLVKQFDALAAKGVSLKQHLFEVGIERLAGGMTNTHFGDTLKKPKTIKFSTFVIQYMKFSGANYIKPLVFNIPSPKMTVNKTDLQVNIPNERELVYG